MWWKTPIKVVSGCVANPKTLGTVFSKNTVLAVQRVAEVVLNHQTTKPPKATGKRGGYRGLQL